MNFEGDKSGYHLSKSNVVKFCNLTQIEASLIMREDETLLQDKCRGREDLILQKEKSTSFPISILAITFFASMVVCFGFKTSSTSKITTTHLNTPSQYTNPEGGTFTLHPKSLDIKINLQHLASDLDSISGILN